MIYPPEIVDEFWKRVEKTDGCWYWLGGRGHKGYGVFKLGGKGRIIKRQAYQVSWEIANDMPFPEGKIACHSCDTPPCVNPEHIIPGTHYDNLHDMISKGRKVVRTATGRMTSKLREHDVRKIQQLLLEESLTGRDIARQFGVSEHTIKNIKHGKSWSHLTAPLAGRMQERKQVILRGERRGHAKLTTENVLRIRELARQGLTQREIAEQFGVVPQTVSKIVNRSKWTHV